MNDNTSVNPPWALPKHTLPLSVMVSAGGSMASIAGVEIPLSLEVVILGAMPLITGIRSVTGLNDAANGLVDVFEYLIAFGKGVCYSASAEAVGLVLPYIIMEGFK